ncbi:hypothetical protein D3C86_1374220 [compost metagenome]
MGRVEHAGGETGFFIRTLRHGIAFQHFQGELAAATLTGDVLDLLQHLLAQAQAAKFFHHRHIVHIDQRPAGKGREPLEAIDQPGRLATDKGQHAESVGAPGELCRELRQYIGWQRLAASHRVLGVVVQHQTNSLGMHRIGVTGLKHKNFCGVHFHPRSHMK